MSRLRMLARMGRMSRFTEAELVAKLGRHGTPDEVQKAVREAFAVPEQELEAQKMALAGTILSAEEVLSPTEGRNVDAEGLDEADRIAESIVQASLGLGDAKKS